jgi:predicted metal-dependent hydrolase
MQTVLDLDGSLLVAVKKDVETMHLSVDPWTDAVRIVAPMRMPFYGIRLFALARLRWIRAQQQKSRELQREITRAYVSRESRYVWGRCCLLTVEEEDAAPSVQLTRAGLLLRVRPGANEVKREAVLEGWYRQLLRDAAPPVIAAWTSRLQVQVNGFYVRRMKTMWGSCNPAARTIRLDTELAEMPGECLDYVVLREMARLLAPVQRSRFLALMDSCMPTWRERLDLLRHLPARHEHWVAVTRSHEGPGPQHVADDGEGITVECRDGIETALGP